MLRFVLNEPKGNEIEVQNKFMKKYMETLTKDVYRGFLTTRELNRMIKGEDFWFTGEEVAERWTTRQEELANE